ncbi:EF-hand-containing protein [Dioscorea alata]|uniref:EF-hand-containing protein n=1 Tax=Dioscorea alata TaxID=55571 RepID=A0ACB7TXP7_DIOAL|nr:EF-hand-containing protein [Dioscorea alata]
MVLFKHHGQTAAVDEKRMSKEQFKEWLKTVDVDGDGKISKQELTNALRALGLHFSGWKAGRGIVHADLNKNKHVDGDKEISALIAYANKRWGMNIY